MATVLKCDNGDVWINRLGVGGQGMHPVRVLKLGLSMIENKPHLLGHHPAKKSQVFQQGIHGQGLTIWN